MTDVQTRPLTDPTSQVDQQLRALEDRLVAEHSGHALSEQVIREYLADARERFANARIRTFLPILIERSVLARLRLDPPL